MFTNQRKASSVHRCQIGLGEYPWLLIPVMASVLFHRSNAQQLTATLSGIATDQTDARIPGAKVVVKNEATGDVRETKADSRDSSR